MGVLLLALVLLFAPVTADAFDEIQVYNAEIAEVGQWTIQQHLNYAFKAPSDQPFPGAFRPTTRSMGRLNLPMG
jgi:hypothetical protein